MELLIGREVVVFEFKGGPGFTPSMKNRIGEIGKIIRQDKNYCTLQFADRKIWNYPYPEVLDHLIAKEPEEEIDINELFEKINKL